MPDEHPHIGINILETKSFLLIRHRLRPSLWPCDGLEISKFVAEPTVQRSILLLKHIDVEDPKGVSHRIVIGANLKDTPTRPPVPSCQSLRIQ